MPPSEIAPADLEACRRILRVGSASFATASRLLPRRVRGPAAVVYAFCRVADDRIDEDPAATDETIAGLRDRLHRAFGGAPIDDPIDRALAVVARNERLPVALPEALLEGLAWDARGRRYETLDDLYAYAARVAGAVGAMMTVLMGARGAGVLARACDLGIAMQLTNIARDVGEDARKGRIYLPLSWMREAGIDPEGFLGRPEHDARLGGIVARLLEAAAVLYRRADPGIGMLPADCRVAIRAASVIYSDIGRVIARNGFDSVSTRAVVSRRRKVWLAARSIVARTGRTPYVDPPLEATRFLVAACQ